MGENGQYQIIEKAEWGVVLSTKCVICGNVLDGKDLSQAYFALYKGDEQLGDICYDCAKAKDKAKILLNQAKIKEEGAKWLRHLAKQDLGPVPFKELEKIRRDTIIAMGGSLDDDYELFVK